MRPMPRLLPVLAALVLSGAAAHPVLAQDPGASRDTVRAPLLPFALTGTVRDTLGHPLRAAEVRAGERVAITDSLGRFRLDSLHDDPIYVVVRRIGYQLAQTTIERQPDVTEIRIGVRLEPSAVQLGTIVVNERRLSKELLRSGYLQRERAGIGTFFDEKKLGRMGHTYTGVLGAVSGVDIQFGNFGSVIALGKINTGMGRGSCVMDVFLDGMYVPWAAELGLNSVIPKRELLAVEVYPRAALVPARFKRGGRVECGAIALWSKPFDLADGDVR